MNILNFTMGPVQADERVRKLGAEQLPYFRTPEFSAILLETEQWIKQCSKAGPDARAVFLTASGTAAMEAAVLGLLTDHDKTLVVNGGGFGQRFADLCQIHGIPFCEIRLHAGEPLTRQHLAPHEGKGYTSFLINLHETSTGVYYDAALVSDFCRRNRLFLIADAISTFLADPLDMYAWGIGAMIVSSQKALACPPGVSILVLSSEAADRIARNPVRSMYFDLRQALADGKRGQTPFTPAVGILLQLHARLRDIDLAGGAAHEIRRTAALAADFRSRAAGLPVAIASPALSNAMTPLHPLHAAADQAARILKEEYGIWVCPNGGALRETIFRVGHIGALTREDNTRLIAALHDMTARKLL